MAEFPEIDLAGWRARVEEERDGAGLDDLTTETLEGLVLAPLYAAAVGDPGYPGVPPFVRGRRALPGAPPWLRWQRIEEPDLDRAADAIAADVAGGVDGIWLRLDRAVRTGRAGADDPDQAGDGLVALDARDLAGLIASAGDGPLALRLDAGANTLPVAAGLFAALEETGRERGSVRVHLGMDPLGALARDGAVPGTIEVASRECALLAARAVQALPGVIALGVDTSPHSRAGADAVQQLAFAMATAIEYLRWLEDHGVEPERAARQIDFVFETDRHLLLEAAKLRAARRLWSRIQRACEVEPGGAWIHAVTGWRTLTRADPWTNVLRATVQTIAAILGGADAITTVPFDRPLGAPDPSAARLARNTQAILAEECGLGVPLDAAGGAYAIEALTARLATDAWERMQQIEASGGMLACLLGGQVHEALAESCRRRADRVRGRQRPVLGVTEYRADDPPLVRERFDPAAALGAAGRRLAERRSSAGQAPQLAPLEAAAYEPGDARRLGDALMTAARSGATFAELGTVMRAGSVPLEITALPCVRDEDLAPEPVDEEHEVSA